MAEYPVSQHMFMIWLLPTHELLPSVMSLNTEAGAESVRNQSVETSVCRAHQTPVGGLTEGWVEEPESG